MRRFRRSERGLSEIVGTLMLVIIVVTAATLLAAFVATYQKQLQTEEAFTHDQSLESIKILGLITSLNSAGTAYRNINFTLASEYINPSIILSISINNYPLVSVWWENPTTHVWSHNPLGSNLTLGPQQEIYVSTNTSSLNNSFLVPPPPPNQYLKFDVDTALQNDFSRVFLPPTSFAVVSVINPSGNNPITLLDGSESFQPGGNASIVNWGWTITSDSELSTGTSLTLATFTQGGSPVTNNNLVSGTVTATGATATFTVPSSFAFVPGNLPYFSLTGNLTISGTGSCTPLSGSSISSGATGSLTLTTLTVTFGFVTTIPAGCSAATLSLDPTGVTLVGPGVSTSSTAAGEEYEVSPSLPTLLVGQAPYSITLVVTNSDGLQGATTLSYTPTL